MSLPITSSSPRSTTAILPTRTSSRCNHLELGLILLFLCLTIPSLLFFFLICRRSTESFWSFPNATTFDQQFHRISLMDYPQARCMDDSIASYYLRLASDHQDHDHGRWLVYFDGGWFCHSTDSCEFRRQYSPKFVSSNQWTINQTFEGIFSSLKHFNLIYVPYCSSDLWSGSSNVSHSHGYDIFQAIFHHQNYFIQAKQIVFTGFSAGGLGLLLNLPSLLPKLSSKTDVRVILDSAWFIEYPGIPNGISKINQGMIYWNTQLPSSCQLESRYRCLFGSEAIRSFPSSVQILVIQSLLDFTQLHLDDHNTNPSDFSSKLLSNLRQSSSQLSIFAPACPLHGFLFRSSWSKFDIKQRTLASILYRWLKRNNRFHFHLIDEEYQSSYCPYIDEDEQTREIFS